jgi:hypothetical protein
LLETGTDINPGTPTTTVFPGVWAKARTASNSLRVTVRDVEGRPVDLVGSPFHIAGTTLPIAKMAPKLGKIPMRFCASCSGWIPHACRNCGSRE